MPWQMPFNFHSAMIWFKILYAINSSPLDKMAAILADDILKWIFLNENGRILILS